jgi:hypothetical protein
VLITAEIPDSELWRMALCNSFCANPHEKPMYAVSP